MIASIYTGTGFLRLIEQNMSPGQGVGYLPNLSTHIELAFRLAPRLECSAIQTHIGYYLLGSTAPDMRSMTKKPREHYHFVSLDFEEIGEGVEQLLRVYPQYRSISEPSIAAFMAGYLTHLTVDETWITKMYRRYFASEIFENDTEGKVMDRVIQLELERRYPPNAYLLNKMDGAVDVPDLGFASSDEITAWRGWVTGFLSKDFSWDRLKFMAKRVARHDDQHPAHEVAEKFICQLPESLDNLWEKVPQNTLSTFERHAEDAIIEHVGRRLTCD